jgi:hypothetical protein
MLDAAEFRSVRRRTMKRVLPDFVESKGVYARRSQGQDHIVELAAKKYGGGFTVDLGVHLDLLPPFPSSSGARIGTQVDACWLRQRLRHGEDDQFWSYGASPEEAETIVAAIAERAISAFEQAKKWSDPTTLLAALPPQAMRIDAEIFARLYDAESVEEQQRLSQTMAIRQLFPGWSPLVGSAAVALGYIAKATGQSPDVVHEYVQVFRGDRGYWGPSWEALVAELESTSA